MLLAEEPSLPPDDRTHWKLVELPVYGERDHQLEAEPFTFLTREALSVKSG